MSPNVARIFLNEFVSIFHAKIIYKSPKTWLGLVCRCCTFKFHVSLPSWYYEFSKQVKFLRLQSQTPTFEKSPNVAPFFIVF